MRRRRRYDRAEVERLAGSTPVVEEEALAGLPRARNVWAYVALWLVVLSWVGLGARMVVGDVGSFDSALDWIYVAVAGLAIVTGGAAVAAIRTRGEPAVAITVFVLSLVLPLLYAAFFGLMWILFGESDGGDGFVD